MGGAAVSLVKEEGLFVFVFFYSVKEFSTTNMTCNESRKRFTVSEVKSSLEVAFRGSEQSNLDRQCV